MVANKLIYMLFHKKHCFDNFWSTYFGKHKHKYIGNRTKTKNLGVLYSYENFFVMEIIYQIN